MRRPSRGATRRKVLSLAVLLVVAVAVATALSAILQPIEARVLPSSTNNNNSTTSPNTTTTMEKGGKQQQQHQQQDQQRRHILVVVQRSLSSAGVAALEREFHDFVKLFFLEQEWREEDEELQQRIRFRRWRGELIPSSHYPKAQRNLILPVINVEWLSFA